jgi:hypothetical protein
MFNQLLALSMEQTNYENTEHIKERVGLAIFYYPPPPSLASSQEMTAS